MIRSSGTLLIEAQTSMTKALTIDLPKLAAIRCVNLLGSDCHVFHPVEGSAYIGFLALQLHDELCTAACFIILLILYFHYMFLMLIVSLPPEYLPRAVSFPPQEPNCHPLLSFHSSVQLKIAIRRFGKHPWPISRLWK